MMRDIYIYATLEAWLKEKPSANVKGMVKAKTDSYIEIEDENGYTQIIVLEKIFAVVY